MKKTMGIVLVLLLFLLFAAPASLALTIKDLFVTVAYLSKEMPDGSFKYGTGFFAGYQASIYLVTAKHVSTFLSVGSKVAILEKGEKAKWLKLEDIIKSKEKADWISHPEADIAIVQLNQEHNTLYVLQKRFLMPGHMHTEEKSLPLPTQLSIIGFPLSLGTIGPHFSPIIRETSTGSGLISAIIRENGSLETFFVTQDPSIGGYSGAPVFENAVQRRENSTNLSSKGPRLVGVVSGTLSDDTGGKLGVIVPSYQLFNMLSQQEKNEEE